MAESVGAALDALIAKAREALQDVQLVRRDERPARALIDLEGRWGPYRIIVSQIHLADGGMRYAYYVLDTENHLVHGFDNSPDIQAIKLRYGRGHRQHLNERVPHQHSAEGVLGLTELMDFDAFIGWLKANLVLEERTEGGA
jgi:hypothetical protein